MLPTGEEQEWRPLNIRLPLDILDKFQSFLKKLVRYGHLDPTAVFQRMIGDRAFDFVISATPYMLGHAWADCKERDNCAGGILQDDLHDIVSE